MFHRVIKLPEKQSFFLFGPRGTGKSTLLRNHFSENVLTIDLLLPREEARFLNEPELLIALIEKAKPSLVIIDEVQKLPKLLDVVHWLIENQGTRFALTGSSARKLKRGHANMLAGRAVVRELFPLTQSELQSEFNLNDTLAFGTLPKIFQSHSATEKNDFLESYANTYVKEEIFAEAILRKLEPFRKFLVLAAQLSGKTLNLTSIADAVGVDPKTVKSYYLILEDTLMGFFLEPFETSLKKRMSKSPKFFFFDTGVSRALAQWIDVLPLESTSYFGELFEQWFISEIFRTIKYLGKKIQMNFYLDHDSHEVDLVLTWPKQIPIFVEIKSAREVNLSHAKGLLKTADSFKESPLILVSQDIQERKIGPVVCLHWDIFLKKLISGERDQLTE